MVTDFVKNITRKEAVAFANTVVTIIIVVATALTNAGFVLPAVLVPVVALATWLSRNAVFSADTVENLFIDLDRRLEYEVQEREAAETSLYEAEVKLLASQWPEAVSGHFDADDALVLADPDEPTDPVVP